MCELAGQPLLCTLLYSSCMLRSELLHEVSQLLHALQRHAAQRERRHSRKVQ